MLLVYSFYLKLLFVSIMIIDFLMMIIIINGFINVDYNSYCYYLFLAGVFMISCALLCDAVIGNVQEKYMRIYAASNTEVVLYSYGLGFLYLAVVMTISGGLFDGINFCSQVIIF